MSRTVHVVEPGGFGGVYQHAACLASALDGNGVPSLLHTASDAEDVTGRDVSCHACFWRLGALHPRPLRRAAVAAGWLARGVPSIVARLRRGDIVHIEGWLRPVMFVPLVVAARARRCVLTYSPHNTFSRRGRRSEERVVRWIARRADTVFAFSEADKQRMEAWGARAVLASLLTAAEPPDMALVAAWRRRWRAGDDQPVVLLAGQLRRDKGLDVLVRALAQSREDLALAVVGEDLGALAGARRLASQLDVTLHVDEGHQPLPRFVAAVAAADVVACPHLVASPSAVLTMAAALGTPTVASALVGSQDAATVVVPAGEPAALASGVRAALAVGRRPASPADDTALAPFLDVFEPRRTVRHRSP